MSYPYWHYDDLKDAEQGRHYAHVRAYSEAICQKAWEIRQERLFLQRQLDLWRDSSPAQAARTLANPASAPASEPVFSSEKNLMEWCYSCEQFMPETNHLGLCGYCTHVPNSERSELGAVPVTPPLSPMGGTQPPKSIKKQADQWRRKNAN